MKEIEKLRREIDETDRKIVDLLEARVKLAIEIGKIKAEQNLGINDAVREQEVLENICSNTSLDKNFIKNLFKDVITHCKSMQASERRTHKSSAGGFQDNAEMKLKLKLNDRKVSVLGPKGTFTEIVAKKIFDDSNFDYRETIEDVFIAAEAGNSGVVPIENSLEGSVSVTMDSLIKYDVKIYKEINLDINLCLIGKDSKIKPGNIKTILSHPQALAQSRNYLKKNFPDAVLKSTSSTAAAAKELENRDDALAIGSKNNAELYNLKIIEENISDDVSRTRFIIISNDREPWGNGNKTSIIFAVKDKPGALFGVLNEFAKQNINLTKIESRPSRRKLGEYFFFIDFEGNLNDGKVKSAVEGIKDKITFLKVLGSY